MAPHKRKPTPLRHRETAFADQGLDPAAVQHQGRFVDFRPVFFQPCGAEMCIRDRI